MRILLLFVFIAIALKSNSQTQLVGIESGINLSNITAKDWYKDGKDKLGYAGGINYELILFNKFSLGADLIYNQLGFNEELSLTNSDGTYSGTKIDFSYKYNYLSLPIKVGYTLGSDLRTYLKVGICPSRLVDAQLTSTEFAVGGLKYGAVNQEISKHVTKFDFSGLMEFGVSYLLKDKYMLFSSVAASRSFNTISNSNYLRDEDMKHYAFSLMFGVKYKLK